MDRRSREAQVQAREDMARRHIEQAMALQALGRGQLGRWLDPTNPEKPTLNIWSVMQLISMGTNLERLARGTPEEEQDPKQPIKVEVEDATWQRVIKDPDALRILDRLAARLGGGEASGGEPGCAG
ncbi:MAG: hypothetical protein GX934_11765 [Burkholderiales bacterium]|nr:hypothetical protein [Burkholderiales bacterium]